MAQKRIALLICSTRTPRVCPSIASWITSLISSHTPSGITLTTIDLADYPLPISPSGSVIAAKLPVPLPPAPYDDEQVNVWSRTVRGFEGFIFLTPQYNWSFPASIKVALDHLFYEWAGKPMMVVSYGGRGGGRASKHLQEVWMGVRGGECIGGVELAVGGEGMGRAQREGILDDAVRNGWVKDGKNGEVIAGWEKLAATLAEEMKEKV